MTTRDEIKAASKRGKLSVADYPRAVTASFNPKTGFVVIVFDNGHGLLIDPTHTVDLRDASAADLKNIKITGPGLGLHFPKIDVDLYVPALIDAHFVSQKLAASKLGASGGKSKSKVKIEAARANGAMGGRPRSAASEKRKRA